MTSVLKRRDELVLAVKATQRRYLNGKTAQLMCKERKLYSRQVKSLQRRAEYLGGSLKVYKKQSEYQCKRLLKLKTRLRQLSLDNMRL